MIPDNAITDLQRAGFLEKLVAAARAKNGLLLSDFENEFLTSYQRYHQYHAFFNAGNGGRRAVCDKLWLKFGNEPEIGFAFPVESRASSVERLPDADPNGCQFLVMDESRRQSPCNTPAVKMRKNGFRYCGSHADEVQLHAKRRGMVVTLFNFQPEGKP